MAARRTAPTPSLYATLKQLAADPSAAQAAAAKMDAAHRRYVALAERASTATGTAQMLKLQIAMQRENTMFTSVSNVLKVRHDTAKNAIGNIR